jgi:hypothetical protein
LKIDEEIIYDVINRSVYPHTLLEDYLLVPHDSGIHIVEIDLEESSRFLITDSVKSTNTQIKRKCKLPVLTNKSVEHATILIYLHTDSKCFEELVGRILQSGKLSKQDEFVAQCLYVQGVLISRAELPYIKNDNKYIGYIDIFESKFKAKVLVNDKFRTLIEREEEDLKRGRNHLQKPQDMTKEKFTWGTITQIEDKKEQGLKYNVFKILKGGKGKGISTGRVCNTLDKKDHVAILAEMNNNEVYENKVENCLNIALELMKNKRLVLMPEYKPLILL